VEFGAALIRTETPGKGPAGNLLPAATMTDSHKTDWFTVSGERRLTLNAAACVGR
jgi:hypothetical protein